MVSTMATRVHSNVRHYFDESLFLFLLFTNVLAAQHEKTKTHVASPLLCLKRLFPWTVFASIIPRNDQNATLFLSRMTRNGLKQPQVNNGEAEQPSTAGLDYESFQAQNVRK